MRIVLPLLLLAGVLASPRTDPSPDLAGIAHVAFRVSDFQKSRDFYRALGFQPAFEFADPGKAPVSYIKINDRQFIELYGRTAASQPLGLMHVCYEAADIETLWNEYTQRGLRPPVSRKARAGNLLFVLHDPEGQTIEYTQYLPGSLHFEDHGKHLGDRRISRHLLSAIIPVLNVDEEHLFYTSKLGFIDVGSRGALRIRLPGHSGDAIGLGAEAPLVKPRIAFEVENLTGAAQELRGRSFTVAAGDGSVSITDPDGNVIEFTSNARESRGRDDREEWKIQVARQLKYMEGNLSSR